MLLLADQWSLINPLYRDQYQPHHVMTPGKGTPSTILYKLTLSGFVRVESGHLSSKETTIGPSHIHLLILSSTTPPPPPTLHYRLTLSLGATKDVPGSSCKEILQSHTSNCYQTPTDGVYWITLTDQCSKLQQIIQVTITTWKHPSYRKFTHSLLSSKRSGVI